MLQLWSIVNARLSFVGSSVVDLESNHPDVVEEMLDAWVKQVEDFQGFKILRPASDVADSAGSNALNAYLTACDFWAFAMTQAEVEFISEVDHGNRNS